MAFDRDIDAQQYAVTATVGQLRPSGWALRGSVGAVLGGELTHEGRRHDVGPGVVAAFGVARQWVRSGWVITGSAALAASRVTTTEAMAGAPTVPLWATDLRLGATVGRPLGPVSPYLLARGFGGPVLWELDGEDLTGTDTSKFQLGVGATIAIGAAAVAIDVAAVGERAASIGATFRL
ncbi:MAG: hypothetical protein KBG48_24915 [Kofleriaceae bacterium]|nr:hypothetical protein [Kofleriaceae bacterium]MBP9170669.1 hypothetical protein [Kofleriaceae bacterium]MBP9860911.1 hypothetical protein [Kofleriaceae bacterium]